MSDLFMGAMVGELLQKVTILAKETMISSIKTFQTPLSSILDRLNSLYSQFCKYSLMDPTEKELRRIYNLLIECQVLVLKCKKTGNWQLYDKHKCSKDLQDLENKLAACTSNLETINATETMKAQLRFGISELLQQQNKGSDVPQVKDFSAPSAVDGYYDVFLSFRGKDTRKGFTTNLYHALRQNEIHTFMDEQLTGEEIDSLFHVIAKSRMAVVIYSKEFASSHWCLQELEMIMKQKREQKMLLTPIFYKVEIDEVKHLTGQTAVSFDKHRTKYNATTVETWKTAVTSFGKVSGISYKEEDTRSEYDFIQHVIDKIKIKLTGNCQVFDQSSMGAKDLLVNSQFPSSSGQGDDGASSCLKR